MNKYSIFSVYSIHTVYLPIAAYKRHLHQRGILWRERSPHGHRNHGATAAYLFHHFYIFHVPKLSSLNIAPYRLDFQKEFISVI
jgi:hypothetical protein